MPDLSPLIDGMDAVIDEIHLHVKCLGEDLLPHDREHIESNLAGGCARGADAHRHAPAAAHHAAGSDGAGSAGGGRLMPRALTYTEMMNGGRQQMAEAEHVREQELQQRVEDLERDVDWLEKSLKGGIESASP